MSTASTRAQDWSQAGNMPGLVLFFRVSPNQGGSWPRHDQGIAVLTVYAISRDGRQRRRPAVSGAASRLPHTVLEQDDRIPWRSMGNSG
jgi:hypothetical protein